MKNQDYNFFWRRIYKSAKTKVFPLRAMFELTYRCNFYCRHCYIPYCYRKYKELKTKEVFSILDQLKDSGCFYLGFTGGEPFIREDIVDILWYAKRCGFEIIIYTNGSLINGKIANELKRLRPNKVDITIPAISQDAFERVTGVAGYRDKVFNGISLLYKMGVNLGFKSCVLKENEDEIDQIHDFAGSLGALHRLDDMLLPCLDGSKEPFKYRGALELESDNQITISSEKEFEDCDFATEHRTPNTEHLFKCGVGETQVAITPLGGLKMCLMIDYPKYNILETSLKECWQGLRKLVENIKPDVNYKCNRCELEAYCKWCPARGWLENGHFTSCTLEARVKAEAVKNLLQSQCSLASK